ncbi:M56 family metallopeptidase [Lysobacter niabensis]|uniref:M56 family metallopeptidase n=1 Tax=Agrilutibacter niabensis TaxID=380628 RepID=UPI00361A2258
MNESLAMLVPVLGRALLHFLWQGAVIGLVAAALLQAMRNARPQARYAVACLALLACALAPVAEVARQLAIAEGGVAPSIAAPIASFAPVVATATTALAAWRVDDALPWIVALWAIGACVLSLRMAMGVWWIQRLCASPQDPGQAAWQARLDALAARFGLRGTIALRLVDSLATPASVGWWRPVVLLPTALLTRMPVELIEALLAHELAHIRRHDYLVNLLQGAVEAMLFYHPATWWLSRQIRIEREHIADQLAVAVTGEPRRLAVALSELSGCLASASPTPSLVLAAHGGRLMSRIEHLVRPGLRRNGGRIAFPLIGLATACLAFYAHAQVKGDPPAKAATVQTASHGNRVHLHQNGKGASYALIRGGRDGYTMSGSSDDMDDIEAARRSLGGDFLWFRKGSQAFVVVDPATVDRAANAWVETDKLGARMEALGNEMEVHGQKMEILGKQMEQLSEVHTDNPAMEKAAARMEDLGRQQEALASKQAKLAATMVESDSARRDQLSREMDALSRQQDALSQQMDAQSDVMDAESKRMEKQMEPMEALGRQMEEAGKPMEALGHKMDALGEQMDQLSEKAERETLKLIDDAVARGLAKPAPTRQ